MITPRPMTLHIRLTRYCNADCAYCSSWNEDKRGYMDQTSLLHSIQFIFEKFNINNKTVRHLTIEYVGGEILTIPFEQLKGMVTAIRNYIASLDISYKDGVQSNLIASKNTIGKLYQLFGDRISSSLEPNNSNERTINGNAQKYQTIFMQNNNLLKNTTSNQVPCVLTITPKNIAYIKDSISQANRENRGLALKPLFLAGKNEQEISTKQLADTYVKVIDLWLFRQRIPVFPLTQMLERRLNNKESHSPCPFRADCMHRTLCLDANGDLYICQEMADSKQHCIGNAVQQTINEELITQLEKRSSHLDQECKSCPYFSACQGGCMSEAISNGNGMYGKPEYCAVWKASFKRIDEKIEAIGEDSVRNWLKRITEQPH